MGITNVGITALNAFRTQLTTTSHNIANVNTEGYSRQTVQLGTLPSTNTSIGAIGNGVQIEAITRQFDQFLMDRVWQYTSSDEEYQVFLDRAQRVDDVIADSDAGLSKALQDFFNSVQDMADDPSATTTRDVLLSNANILVDRFNTVYNFLDGLRTEINQDLETVIGEANTLAETIADLNVQIRLFTNTSGGSTPNDLLDRRDNAISQLAELVNITAVQQSDNTVNVFIGNGQGLVIGERNFNLGTDIDPNEPDRLDITMETSGNIQTEITDFLSGGKFGGLLRFRDTILDPTQNAIGRLAFGMGTLFNEQHNLGMDLNGALGQDFFYVPDPVTPDANGAQMLLTSVSGGITISAIDPTQLSTADYELSYDGSWSLLNRQTGETTNPIFGGGTYTFDGIELTLPGTYTPAIGDSYIIRPTRNVGRAIDVNINDASNIAAASPVSVSETDVTGAPPFTSNTGNGAISDTGLVSPLTGSSLASLPIVLTFNANTFSVSAGALNSTAYDPLVNSGDSYTLTIPGLGNFEFTMSGTPADGDQFTFGRNDNPGEIAIGDNRNALKLAALQTGKTMRDDANGDPTSSFVSLYASLIGNVGSDTRQAQISSETQERLREQAIESLDQVSGVNLDEEAAKLVTFQQAYQAAAQVIRVSNSLFDSLLNAI